MTRFFFRKQFHPNSEQLMDQKNHHIEDERIVFHLNSIQLKGGNDESMRQSKQASKKEKACKAKIQCV